MRDDDQPVILDFILEEAEARGWTLDDVATKMVEASGGDYTWQVARCALDFLGLREVKMLPRDARVFALVFGTSDVLWRRLATMHGQWMPAKPDKGP